MDMHCCPMASTRVPTGSTEGPIGVFCNGGPVAMGGTAGTTGCTGGPMAPSTTHRALVLYPYSLQYYNTIQPPAHTHRASSAI